MPDNKDNNNNQSAGDQESKFGTFEEFLATVDKPVKELYDSHTSGLKTALQKERDDRAKIQKELVALSQQIEKGSDLDKKFQDTLKQLDETEKRYLETKRRADFIESALKPEIGCTNARAAFAIALAENLFDENGNPDWKSIKKSAPELFRTTKVTDAGNQNKSTSLDMNAALRQAAGIKEK